MFGVYFTDRDHGEGFVLSADREASGTGKGEYIKTNRINSAGDGPVKGQLFCMCQNVRHGYKQTSCKLGTNV